MQPGVIGITTKRALDVHGCAGNACILLSPACPNTSSDDSLEDVGTSNVFLFEQSLQEFPGWLEVHLTCDASTKMTSLELGPTVLLEELLKVVKENTQVGRLQAELPAAGVRACPISG